MLSRRVAAEVVPRRGAFVDLSAKMRLATLEKAVPRCSVISTRQRTNTGPIECEGPSHSLCPRFVVMGAAFMVPALGLTSSPIAAADGVPLVHGDVLASVGSGTVDNYSPTGTLNDTLDTTTGATYTTGGCFDSSGNFYVTDFGSDEISKFNSSGNLVNADWASPNNTPESCTVDASGDVYVGGPTQPSGPTIYEYNSSGTQINAFSVTGVAELAGPTGSILRPTNRRCCIRVKALRS